MADTDTIWDRLAACGIDVQARDQHSANDGKRLLIRRDGVSLGRFDVTEAIRMLAERAKP